MADGFTMDFRGITGAKPVYYDPNAADPNKPSANEPFWDTDVVRIRTNRTTTLPDIITQPSALTPGLITDGLHSLGIGTTDKAANEPTAKEAIYKEVIYVDPSGEIEPIGGISDIKQPILAQDPTDPIAPPVVANKINLSEQPPSMSDTGIIVSATDYLTDGIKKVKAFSEEVPDYLKRSADAVDSALVRAAGSEASQKFYSTMDKTIARIGTTVDSAMLNFAKTDAGQSIGHGLDVAVSAVDKGLDYAADVLDKNAQRAVLALDENVFTPTSKAISEQWNKATDGKYGNAVGATTSVLGAWGTYGVSQYFRGSANLLAWSSGVIKAGSELLPGERNGLENALGGFSQTLEEAADFYKLTARQKADATETQLMAAGASQTLGAVIMPLTPLGFIREAKSARAWFSATSKDLLKETRTKTAEVFAATKSKAAKALSENAHTSNAIHKAKAIKEGAGKAASKAKQTAAPAVEKLNKAGQKTLQKAKAPAQTVGKGAKKAANAMGKEAKVMAKEIPLVDKVWKGAKAFAKAPFKTLKGIGRALIADAANGFPAAKALISKAIDWLLKAVTNNPIAAAIAGVSVLAAGYLSMGGKKERKKEGFFGSSWKFVKGAAVGVAAAFFGFKLWESINKEKTQNPSDKVADTAGKSRTMPRDSIVKEQVAAAGKQKPTVSALPENDPNYTSFTRAVRGHAPHAAISGEANEFSASAGGKIAAQREEKKKKKKDDFKLEA